MQVNLRFKWGKDMGISGIKSIDRRRDIVDPGRVSPTPSNTRDAVPPAVNMVVRPVVRRSYIGGFEVRFAVEGVRRGIVSAVVALKSDIGDTIRHR